MMSLVQFGHLDKSICLKFNKVVYYNANKTSINFKSYSFT